MNRSDEDDYRRYVQANLDTLRRFAFLLCHDWHLADDMVGVALGNLYRSWARARDVVHLDAYVRKIVVRSWLDERRRPWRREFATEQLPDQPVPDDTDAVDSASALDVLAGLTPRRRAAVILRFYFDLSVEETAELLGCSPGTVRSLTARGLETARRRATSGNGDTA